MDLTPYFGMVERTKIDGSTSLALRSPMHSLHAIKLIRLRMTRKQLNGNHPVLLSTMVATILRNIPTICLDR